METCSGEGGDTRGPFLIWRKQLTPCSSSSAHESSIPSQIHQVIRKRWERCLYMIILFQGPLWQAWLKHDFLSQWWHGEWSHPVLKTWFVITASLVSSLHWQMSHAVPDCNRLVFSHLVFLSASAEYITVETHLMLILAVSKGISRNYLRHHLFHI